MPLGSSHCGVWWAAWVCPCRPSVAGPPRSERRRCASSPTCR
jgi:hypothetical protein